MARSRTRAGGVECGSVTEIFGESRSGKSQLCATLCVTSQLSRDAGGGEGKVIYLDTEDALYVCSLLHPCLRVCVWSVLNAVLARTPQPAPPHRATRHCSRPERVAQIAKDRYGLDPDAVLDNMLVARCLNHEHQMEMLSAVAAKIVEDSEPYRLLIVDSIIGLFRVEYTGRGELSERQQKLGQHVHELVKLAQEFGLAVVVTNQMCADPGV
jgi:meiotic recombination protein DMC1